jgi:Zn-dependent protease
MGATDPAQMLAMALVIFFGIGIHEYAHCKFADMAGDPTPGIYGRVTLNLFKHFDLFGTLMILFTIQTGYGIGWGKPAPMDPKRMRDPRWDFFVAVAAGPVSNLVQAVLYGMLGRMLIASGSYSTETLLRSVETHDLLGMLVIFGILTNLSLAVFNLIPLGPLDGHWLVGLLMPERPRDQWYLFNQKYGFIALIAVVLLGQATEFSLIGSILRPIVIPLFRLFIGIP